MGTHILNSNLFNANSQEIHQGPREWVEVDLYSSNLPSGWRYNFSYINNKYIVENLDSCSDIYICEKFNGVYSNIQLPSFSKSKTIFYCGLYYKFKRNYMMVSPDLIEWVQISNQSSDDFNFIYVSSDNRLVAINGGNQYYTSIGNTDFICIDYSSYIGHHSHLLKDNSGTEFWIYSSDENNYCLHSTNCGVTFEKETTDVLSYGVGSCCIDDTNVRWITSNTENVLHAYVENNHCTFPLEHNKTNITYGHGIILATYEETRNETIMPNGIINLNVYLNYGYNDKKLRRYKLCLSNSSNFESSSGFENLFFVNDRFVWVRDNLIFYSLPIGSGDWLNGDGELYDEYGRIII